jgi:hypothetical protein
LWIDSLAGGCLPAGTYRVRVEIPPLWLVPDLYTVHFKLLADDNTGKSVRRFSERVLLNVTSSGDQTGGVGQLNAKLIPEANWQIDAGETMIDRLRHEKTGAGSSQPAKSVVVS